jgi:hypothetical protein
MSTEMREFFARKLLPESGNFRMPAHELSELAATDSKFDNRWQQLLALRDGNAQKAKEFIRNSLNYYARTKPRPAGAHPVVLGIQVFNPATNQIETQEVEDCGGLLPAEAEFFRAAFPDRKGYPLTHRELEAALRSIEGLEAQWHAVVQRMPGKFRRQKAITAINQCLRIGQQTKAFWDRQQVLTAQIRRWAIARG